MKEERTATMAPDRSVAAQQRLRVKLGERSYEIVVGRGLLADSGRHLRPLLPQPRVIIITDSIVADLYLKTLEAALDDGGISHAAIVLPPGERTKDFDQLRALVDQLLDANIERRTTLVALGGGVIGDITGFAAGIVLRGLGFVQIPTTLLAQVDSSVGGKTGINTRHGKNLVGVFHQPRLVLADVETLNTLDPRQLRAGYAEVVKYGLISDQEFFSWLEADGVGVLAGETVPRTQAVLTSCAAKAAIVEADEREEGVRALLNFGHTFGHALEAELGYDDTLLHGEAVAFGMVVAFELSKQLGLCHPADALRVRRHLAAARLPTDFAALPPRTWSADRLIDHMTRDKKVKDGRLTFILVRGIGRAFITNDIPVDDVRQFLANSIGSR